MGISAATIVGCIEMMLGSVHACVSIFSCVCKNIFFNFKNIFKFKIAIGKMIGSLPGKSNQETEKGVQVSPGPSRAAQDNFHPIPFERFHIYPHN